MSGRLLISAFVCLCLPSLANHQHTAQCLEMTQGRCAIGKRVALLFSILLFSATAPQETEGFLEAVATGLEVIVHTIESIQQTWEIVEATDVLKHGDGKANPNIKDLVSRKQHELMGRLVEIYRGIENIEHDVSEWSGVE